MSGRAVYGNGLALVVPGGHVVLPEVEPLAQDGIHLRLGLTAGGGRDDNQGGIAFHSPPPLLLRRPSLSTAPVKPTPDVPAETVEERFHRVAAQWHRSTDYLLSMDEAESHPAYEEIVRLGPAVTPPPLRDLAENHTHWFTALEAITGALSGTGFGGRQHPQDGGSVAPLGQGQRLPMVTPLEEMFPGLADGGYRSTSPTFSANAERASSGELRRKRLRTPGDRPNLITLEGGDDLCTETSRSDVLRHPCDLSSRTAYRRDSSGRAFRVLFQANSSPSTSALVGLLTPWTTRSGLWPDFGITKSNRCGKPTPALEAKDWGEAGLYIRIENQQCLL